MAVVISGKVTDLTGNGLADIEVHASNLGEGSDGNTTTGENGSYQITNLNAGKYELHVSSAGKFEPPNYHLNVKQSDNLMGRNFKRIGD